MLLLVQGLIQEEKVGTNGEESAQISIVGKKICNTKVTPDYDYITQTLHITIILMFLCYYVHVMLLVWSKN